MNEFEVIDTYFSTLCPLGVDNDAAVLDIPSDHELVVSSDTLNEGVHFPVGANPRDIAQRALRVNLSDLAAMGARPLSYQLNIAFPSPPDQGWLKAFTQALKKDQDMFNIFCSGGDTTRIEGALSITITIMGIVKSGQAWVRSGASVGDALVLTGPVGDSWLGLQVVQNRLSTSNDMYLIDRFYRPTPRFFDPAIPEQCTDVKAAIDVSDGVVADLTHMCRASSVAAEIDLHKVPFSDVAIEMLGKGEINPQDLLTGGEDFELLLAVPFDVAERYGTVIGAFTADAPMVTVMDQSGEELVFSKKGWTHF